MATTPASAAVNFMSADLDGDARVSPRELELWQGHPGAGDDFDIADGNLDGAITLDEWQAMARHPSAASGASVGWR